MLNCNIHLSSSFLTTLRHGFLFILCKQISSKLWCHEVEGATMIWLNCYLVKPGISRTLIFSVLLWCSNTIWIQQRHAIDTVKTWILHIKIKYQIWYDSICCPFRASWLSSKWHRPGWGEHKGSLLCYFEENNARPVEAKKLCWMYDKQRMQNDQKVKCG